MNRADYISKEAEPEIIEVAKQRLKLEPIDASFNADSARELVIKKKMEDIKKQRKQCTDIIADYAKSGFKKIEFSEANKNMDKTWLFNEHKEYLQALGFKCNYSKFLFFEYLDNISWE